MDPCRHGEDHPSPLVEGAKSQWEGVNRHPPDKWRPWQCWSPPMGPLAGSSVQAVFAKLQGGGMPSPGLADSILQISYSILMFLVQGFPCLEAGENPGLSPGAAGLHQRVRGPNRHPLWVSMLTSKVHDPPDGPWWWWHSWGLPSKTHRRGTQKTPHTRGGGHPSR